MMDKDRLLAKWLSGDISPEELQALEKHEDLSVYKKIIDKTTHFQVPEYNETNELKAVHKTLKTNKAKVKKMSPLKSLSAVAASIALLLGSYFFFSNTNTVITTLSAEKTEVVLPDNSEVFMNTKSEVSYNKDKWSANRELKLKGEAFFSVEKGKKFDVVTSAGTISVLGTRFNVKNRKNLFEVTCYEGEVAVSYNKKTKKLQKGNTFKVVNNQEVEVALFNNEKPWWLLDKSTFNKIPYKLVLEEFENTFGVAIKTKNIDTNYHFTGEFSHTDKELAIKTITKPFNFKYEWLDSKKVLIYAKK